MNQNIIKIGKTTLTTIMATSMSLSVVSSFPVLAQESTSQDTVSEPAVVSNFAPEEDPSKPVEQYRSDLENLITEIEASLTPDKYCYDREKAYGEDISKAREVLQDPVNGQNTAKLSWQCYYLKNDLSNMKKPQNIMSESSKKIDQMYREFLTFNEAEYDLTKFNAFKEKIKSAKTKVYSNSSKDYTEVYDELVPLFEELKNAKIDANLAALKTEFNEAHQFIIDLQYEKNLPQYVKESWQTFTAAYQAAKAEIDKAATTIDPQLAQTLLNNLKSTRENLKVRSDGQSGVEAGFRTHWTDQSMYGDGWFGYQADLSRGGKLYVSNEVINDDGTSTITVTFINDGTDPLTGGYFHNHTGPASSHKEEWGLRPYEKWMYRNDKLDLDIVATKPDGTREYFELENLGDKVVDGFTYELDVPQESGIDLDISQWNNGRYTTSSLGTYYTGKYVEPEVIPPVITVPADEVTIELGSKFDPMKGVSAKDKDGVDLTNSIQFESNVDTSKVGDYTVKYTITDKNGVTVVKTIKVKVIDKKESADKKTPKKDQGKNTGLITSTGLLTSMLGASAAGLGVVEILKRRKK